jgi:ABC-2 type transport system ATP-binding protein
VGARQTGAVAAAIETDDLSRSFSGELALDGLTVELPAGEVLALLGPNGAGKTTTVRLLNGVLAPDRGSSRVLGLDSQAQATEVRRRTGVLTENAGLDDRLTAFENLEATGRMRGMGRADVRRRAADLLERFGMAARAGDLVQGFSTGQRKRVALARALLHDPEVLFLDEPTSGLDPSATRQVIDLIATMAGEQGRTVVLCTHFLGEAGRLAHRMAVLHRGRLRACGRPDELAAGIWHGLDAAVDLGGRAGPDAMAAIASAPGVLEVEPSDEGAMVKVDGRPALAAVVAALVAAGVPVYAAVPRPRTLEDVYFAIEAEIAAEESA